MLQSLRARLTALGIGITMVSLVAMAVATLFFVRSETLSGLDTQLGQRTEQHAQEISDWLAAKQDIVQAMAPLEQSTEPEAFLGMTKNAGGFDTVFFSHADKRHYSTSSQRAADYDPTSRPWYQQAVQAGKPSVSAPYIDATTGRLTVTVTTPFGSAGQVRAVAGADLFLDAITEKVRAIRPQSESFALLTDGQGNILAHERSDLALKPFSALTPELNRDLVQGLAKNKTRADVNIEGKTYMAYAAPVAGTPWLLMIALERNQATAAVGELMVVAALITALCVAVATVVLLWAMRHLLRRLPLVRDALADIASGEGDLTRRMDTSGNDELAQIGRAFNQFADKIADVLLRIRDAAEEVRLASTEIALGNQDLSSRTEQQASSLEETAAAMEQLTVTVQQNAGNARHGTQRQRGGGAGWQRCGRGGADHGGDRGGLAQDRGHHQRDRRHCLSDQYPGAECRRRGRSGGRAGPGFCRGGQ